MRQLRAHAAYGHPGATLALEVFLHCLLLGIGAMASSLWDVDALALSGGIGQNDQRLANDVRQRLTWLPAFKLKQVPADGEGMVSRVCRRAVG